MTVSIRRAIAEDQASIVALVRAERLNPNGLYWENFVVAIEGDATVGAAQIRRHADGARELASLVVAKEKRGAGLAARLVEALLSAETGRVYLVTGRTRAAHYARWGFLPVRLARAPRGVARNLLLGQAVGGVHAVATRRPINWLVVLERHAAPQFQSSTLLRRSADFRDEAPRAREAGRAR